MMTWMLLGTSPGLTTMASAPPAVPPTKSAVLVASAGSGWKASTSIVMARVTASSVPPVSVAVTCTV